MGEELSGAGLAAIQFQASPPSAIPAAPAGTSSSDQITSEAKHGVVAAVSRQIVKRSAARGPSRKWACSCERIAYLVANFPCSRCYSDSLVRCGGTSCRRKKNTFVRVYPAAILSETEPPDPQRVLRGHHIARQRAETVTPMPMGVELPETIRAPALMPTVRAKVSRIRFT